MINVDTVYKTVLLILNKEQRGYMTPDEFNKAASKAQLDIFEQYFDDLNQQLRVPQADSDYSDRRRDLDDKISSFKCMGECVFTSGQFNLPVEDVFTGKTIVYNDDPAINELAFYRLGSVVFNNGTTDTDVQRLQRNEFYNIDKSELTAPSASFPVYIHEGGRLSIKPSTLSSGVQASFIRKPRNVKWAFTVGSVGQYVYDDSANSTNFELSPSEQVRVINRVLFYSGLILKDPQVVQAAAQQVQQEETNKKS